MKETSYVMVKPEFADNSNVVKEIIRRIQDSGLKIEEQKYIRYDVEHARRHYHEHVGKSFYPDLERYITSGIAYGMVVSGENAIAKIRAMCGATKNPSFGTIRHDIPKLLGLEIRVTQNVVHSSDSPSAAEREIAIFRDLKALKTNIDQTK